MTNLEKRQLRADGRDPNEVHRQRLEVLTGPIRSTVSVVPADNVDDILIARDPAPGPATDPADDATDRWRDNDPEDEIDTRPPPVRRRFGGMRGGTGGLIALMLLTGISGLGSGAYPPPKTRD